LEQYILIYPKNTFNNMILSVRPRFKAPT